MQMHFQLDVKVAEGDTGKHLEMGSSICIYR